MSQQEEPTAEHFIADTIKSKEIPAVPAIDEGAVLTLETVNDSCATHFNVENSFYRSRLPKATHWSIAWSDLMMTMFVLFLSMFVYQAAHQDFLVDKTPEIVGGKTTDALDIDKETGLIIPIVPIKEAAPLIIGGTIKRVETVKIDDVNIDEVFKEQIIPEGEVAVTAESTTKPPLPPAELPENVIDTIPEPVPLPQKDIIEPPPLSVETPAAVEEKPEDTFHDIYDMSKQALTDNKMGDFASVDLVRDTTMRIILTGDLLFSTGQADLSSQAKNQLQKLSAVIKNTPYMINVIGHTDNQPMHSPLFATNWELSVVRASRVARFLIETMGMNPQQFIVSGYGANRPRVPNSNIANRAANRRVEIIISKKLAPPVKATPENLL